MNRDKAGKVFPRKEILKISALKVMGIDGLKKAIQAHTNSRMLLPDREALFASQGQKEALETAIRDLQDCKKSLAKGTTEEIWAEYLRRAAEAVGLFSGDTVSNEVLDQVFSRFCIGK